MREIIVIVPRGTKVRYIESDVEEIYAVDSKMFEFKVTSEFLGGSIEQVTGVPVYDMEKWEP